MLEWASEEQFTENSLTLTKKSKWRQLLVVLSFTHRPRQCQLHWKFIAENKNMITMLRHFVSAIHHVITIKTVQLSWRLCLHVYLTSTLLHNRLSWDMRHPYGKVLAAASQSSTLWHHFLCSTLCSFEDKQIIYVSSEFKLLSQVNLNWNLLVKLWYELPLVLNINSSKVH